ncbi:hypothetical protein E2C01_022054 [Portunus trituberculatus]|uniref:Uncharacterized protein n=1 Tax=Portunus trituberculatus TaxID=210409 RepID=A0A5B7E6M5_PORTR|nr:hypothetical protein [Portunus trituberculatus]
MKVNVAKTKFFVGNGDEGDTDPLHVSGLIVEHCSGDVYRGSPFMCDGSVSIAVKLRAQSKLSHVLKFVSFIQKNNDVPFFVKRRLFDAALMSTLLHGCESWSATNLRGMIKLYNWSMKELLGMKRAIELLGVRRATANSVCYSGFY